MHSFRTIEKPFRMHVMSWGYYHQSFTNKIDKNQRHHSLGIDRYDIERMEKDGNVIILKINAYHSDRSFRTCEKNKLRQSSLMNPFHHFSIHHYEYFNKAV